MIHHHHHPHDNDDDDLVIKGGRKMGERETILGWQRLGGAF